MELHQDMEGTKAMLVHERRSRERYNCCIAKDTTPALAGSFFKEN